ncbi:uncharacterized protein LOC141652424 isoform X1 [Silene latifolia]|uniref:uncharacterized protein LOC141652424 isoform X1 n=1 Tax=Silene latifolia TaxID=37657 RepID=UPI003D787580
MGVVIYWYDAICFAIVGVAMLVSVYMLWTRERGGRMEETIMYHSFLVPRLHTYHNNNNNNNFISWSQLWSSCWRGLHPGWLLGFRLTSFFLLAAFLSWDIHVWGASIFIYYTEWTFALVMLYFAIGSVMSAYGCWLYCSKHGRSLNVQDIEADGDTGESRSRKGDSNYYQEQEQEPTLQRAGFWGYLMQIVYQTCAGAVILTDVVFWGIIVPLLSNARLGLNLLMGCMHTVNAVLLIVDTSINGLPFPWFRLAYFVLWSSAYVVFQWVIHLIGFSWWPYPFLELSTPTAPFSYLILAVSHIACYGLYALIVKFKDFIFTRLFPDSYIRLY